MSVLNLPLEHIRRSIGYRVKKRQWSCGACLLWRFLESVLDGAFLEVPGEIGPSQLLVLLSTIFLFEDVC